VGFKEFQKLAFELTILLPFQAPLVDMFDMRPSSMAFATG
jgi:hypothetical protein